MSSGDRRSRAPLLVAIALSAALAPLNSTMVAVALPVMASALAIDSGALRHALVTAYLLTSIVLQSPGGKLGDRLGHHRTLGIGQLVLGAGAILAYLRPELPTLAASRVVMAAGGAIVVPSATALIRTELPPDLRGRAFGAFGAVMALSAAIGPQVGAALVAGFGWPSIFLANVPVLVVAWLLSRGARGRRAEDRADEPVERAAFDLVGSVLLGACLMAIAIGAEREDLRALLVVGALGFVPFALWERRVADPVVDFALFRRPAFAFGTSLIALQNVAMYSLLFELPQVATRIFGASPEAVGGTLLALMGAMVVASPLSGRASERFGARPMALLGSLASLAGLVLFRLSAWDVVTDAIPSLLLVGAGIGLGSAPAQAAAMSAAPREKSGMAAGLAATMRYLGGVIGLSILGAVLGDAQDPDVARMEHARALLVYVAALVLATLCSLALPARGPRANGR